jgi:hypothetical protein
VTFTWLVNPAPGVADPGRQLMADDTTVSLPMSGKGGTGPLTWSASGLPAGLSINPTTGVISGKPATPGAQPYLSVTVTATDSRRVSGSITFAWCIMDVRVNNVGDSVNLQFYVPGGTPVASTATNLPSGLSISPTGLITGTITGGTNFQPHLVFTDPSGAVIPWDFVWRVGDPSGLRITAAPRDRLTDPVNKAITPITAAAAGGSGSYIWSADPSYPLPKGVTISSSGVISGTPTKKGTYTVKLIVRDSRYGTTATVMFVWGVQ